MRRLFIVFNLAMLSLVALAAQEQPVPSLKPEVALQIKDAQLRLTQTRLAQQKIILQYTEMEQEANKIQLQINVLTMMALKQSGIDEEKWQLDPATLTVTAHIKKEPENKESEGR